MLKTEIINFKVILRGHLGWIKVEDLGLEVQ